MTRDPVDFWYYNNPQISLLDPDLGPESGGNDIVLRGENFMPFRTDMGELDIDNSTFCNFLTLGVKTEAQVTN
jgi:hypothetical protein